ncbi:hypothetical protein [Natrinema amylolyticum]|uniref:hypothetical protein n=1 Tax=Natrinema amylolyticum TaxID=2878679 RepID=UPI001CF99455|nr:hypothetical protein [Natrinema amylolyticum]
MAEMKDRDKHNEEYHSTAKQYALDDLTEKFMSINGGRKDELVIEAAKILDDTAEQIAKLERLLIEYEGKPIYSGESEYLEEAKIKPES